METFLYKHTLIGIRISAIPKGSVPATNKKEPLQIVTLRHPKGAYLQAHYHKQKVRKTSYLQECLIVKKGKIKIDLYTTDGKHVRRLFLSAGQAFILLSGGYGITILEDTEVFEVKNGPFIEDKVIIQQ